MNLMERVKGILMTPGSTWDTIAGEDTTTAMLYREYILPLAAIGPVASIIGLSLLGMRVPSAGMYRVPVMTALSQGVATYVFTLLGVYLIALAVDAMAPHFDGEKNPAQALKLTAYATTPSWIAGILNLVPALGIVAMLAALYGTYLLYLGLPKLMKVPQDKAVLFTVAVLVAAYVAVMVMGTVLGLFMNVPHGLG